MLRSNPVQGQVSRTVFTGQNWGRLQTSVVTLQSLWHEFFKKHFLTSEAVEMAGEVIIMSPSTTKLSKAQFADYIEQVFAWLAVNVK
jgi:hypothetical protein